MSDYPEKHYEIIEDKKIPLSKQTFEHNLIKTNLVVDFLNYCRKIHRGKVFAGLYVYFPDNNLFIPDISIFLDDSLFKPNQNVHGVPDLVVEILSPSTAKKDFSVKKDAYERNGVKEYWIVNHVDKSVQVYHLIEGKYELDHIYHVYTPDELARLEEYERAELRYEIKVSIFDDLIVDVDDIFYDL